MSDPILQVPSAGKGDAVHAVVRAGLSAIPVVGGPAVEVSQQLVQPPLERRRAEWMREVGERLIALESKGLNLESLRDNEQFLSAALCATQFALRTHQAEKRRALLNAVLNVASGKGPDETVRHLFLSMIDVLGDEHLRVLKLFQSPIVPPGRSFGSLRSVLEYSIREARTQPAVYAQLWQDLHDRGLVAVEDMSTTMSPSGMGESQTTELGEGFL